MTLSPSVSVGSTRSTRHLFDREAQHRCRSGDLSPSVDLGPTVALFAELLPLAGHDGPATRAAMTREVARRVAEQSWLSESGDAVATREYEPTQQQKIDLIASVLWQIRTAPAPARVLSENLRGFLDAARPR